LTDSVLLSAGANVSLTPSGNNIQISATGGGIWNLNGASAYYNGGNVGIGTATPFVPLEIVGAQAASRLSSENSPNGSVLILKNSTASPTYLGAINFDNISDTPGQIGYFADDHMGFRVASAERLTISASGNVGIGTTGPWVPLDIVAEQAVASLSSTSSGNGSVLILKNSSESPAYLGAINFDNTTNTPGQIGYFADDHMGFRVASAEKMTLDAAGNLNVTGKTTTRILTIVGGSDLAEPFQMSDGEIPKGSLVMIDEENPGKLRLAAQEYDTRVAGIVSGANGINPGISLRQEGVMDAGENVALSGRVYALADATSAAIKPGDLLTSSATPGHVMKVTDQTRSQGAIVGKAMSALKGGKGMVLVLVTLQ
jgi:hypothetical protein